MATRGMRTARTANIRKPRYEPVLQLPPLPDPERQGLHDSIAIHGVLVPILVDSDGPPRKIIDGNYRKEFADEFGYTCPEIVVEGLSEEEKRTLARSLNLARRQLSPKQRRQVIADQLRETADRTNRWVAKQLGVHHATVASVRLEMESSGQIIHYPTRVGSDGRIQPARKIVAPVLRSAEERRKRIEAVTLIRGDCREKLPKLPAASVVRWHDDRHLHGCAIAQEMLLRAALPAAPAALRGPWEPRAASLRAPRSGLPESCLRDVPPAAAALPPSKRSGEA